MDTHNENLKELIKTFMDKKEVQTYLDDIVKGDKILQKYPAPQPDDMLIANIKANISLGVKSHKHNVIKHMAFRGLAVAASIIIIVSIFLNPQPPESKLPDGFWDNGTDLEVAAIGTQLNQIGNRLIELLFAPEDNYIADAELLQIENDIEQVKDYLVTLETQEDDYYSTSVFDEIENRLDQMDNNFWNDSFDTEFEELQSQPD